nr:MAG TPA: Small acid-soluble spore protein P family [Caudoviricetes sp.]
MKKFTLSKAIRNDQPTETVTPTVPYGSPLKGSVVELRRAWRGYGKGHL